MRWRFLPVTVALLFVSAPAWAEDEPATDEAAVVEAPPEPAPPTPPRKVVPVMRFDGGYAARRLHSIPIDGGALGVALGAEMKWVAFIGSLQGTFGSTENGLGARSATLMYETDIVFGRFRLGAGVGLTWFGLDRAVRDATISSRGWAVRAATRFDVVRTDGYAIFARGAIEYTSLQTGQDADFWGPTFTLGVDFDLMSRTRTP
jgi:hypothetical protein